VETGCSAIKNLFGSILARARLNAGTSGSMNGPLAVKKIRGYQSAETGLPFKESISLRMV
jgi:hypothetical protein